MKKLVLLAIATVALFMGCNDNKEGNDEASANDKVEQGKVDNEYDAAFKHYIDLKNALVASDSDKAKLHASELEKELSKVSNDSSISETRVHAKAIAKTSDITQQRSHFAFLTSCIIPALKSGSLGKDKFYIQHCPMALDNKGADWVSESSEIKNPYFGDEMLNGGEVKESVN